MKEIKGLEFFIPKGRIRKMMTADEAFAQFSERGIQPDFSRIENPYRYFQLIEAKSWRGITVHELWEKGILDGSVPYFVLLGGESPREIPPIEVVNFMKKEIFKGHDKDLIESVYKDIISYWTWWRKFRYYFSEFVEKLKSYARLC